MTDASCEICWPYLFLFFFFFFFFFFFTLEAVSKKVGHIVNDDTLPVGTLISDKLQSSRP